MSEHMEVFISWVIGLIFIVGFSLFAYESYKNYVVKITVEYDLDSCASDSPLLVTIFNDSRQDINKLDFDIKISKKGFDRDLRKVNNRFSISIVHIPSNTLTAYCGHYELIEGTHLINNPAKLEFEIINKNVTLKGF